MADFSEIKSDSKSRMDKTIETLRGDFGSLRAGRAHVSLLDGIMVEAYGSMTPLSQVGTVSVPDPRTLSIRRPLSCGSGFIFPSGIILSGNNANINAGWSLNEKGSNGQSKFVAGCKSKKKSFRISESFFYDYFLAAIIFNASSKVSSLSLNSRGMA